MMAKNYLSRSLLLLAALLFGTVAAYAQKITIRGVVSDEQGAGLGVAVVLLVLRAPFLVVVIGAAAAAAGLRALGWA